MTKQQRTARTADLAALAHETIRKSMVGPAHIASIVEVETKGDQVTIELSYGRKITFKVSGVVDPGSSGRHLGECEVCEEVRMVRSERFRGDKVRICRTCAATGREIEQDEAMTAQASRHRR